MDHLPRLPPEVWTLVALMLGNIWSRRALDRVLTRVAVASGEVLESYFDVAAGPVWRTSDQVLPRTAAAMLWLYDLNRDNRRLRDACWLEYCKPVCGGSLAFVERALAVLKCARVTLTPFDVICIPWARGAAASRLVDEVVPSCDEWSSFSDYYEEPSPINAEVLTLLAARFGAKVLYHELNTYHYPGIALRQLDRRASPVINVVHHSSLAEYIWVYHVGGPPASVMFDRAVMSGHVVAAEWLARRHPDHHVLDNYCRDIDYVMGNVGQMSVDMSAVRRMATNSFTAVYVCKCGRDDCLKHLTRKFIEFGDVAVLTRLPRLTHKVAVDAFAVAIRDGRVAVAAWLRHKYPAAAPQGAAALRPPRKARVA